MYVHQRVLSRSGSVDRGPQAVLEVHQLGGVAVVVGQRGVGGAREGERGDPGRGGPDVVDRGGAAGGADEQAQVDGAQGAVVDGVVARPRREPVEGHDRDGTLRGDPDRAAVARQDDAGPRVDERCAGGVLLGTAAGGAVQRVDRGHDLLPERGWELVPLRSPDRGAAVAGRRDRAVVAGRCRAPGPRALDRSGPREGEGGDRGAHRAGPGGPGPCGPGCARHRQRQDGERRRHRENPCGPALSVHHVPPRELDGPRRPFGGTETTHRDGPARAEQPNASGLVRRRGDRVSTTVSTLLRPGPRARPFGSGDQGGRDGATRTVRRPAEPAERESVPV